MPRRASVTSMGKGFFHRANGQSRMLRQFSRLIVLNLILVATTAVEAGTIVRISTSVGDFSIELYDGITWRTVANFLNYVNGEEINELNGEVMNYNQTYLHRTQTKETQGLGIVQGGGFRFRPYQGTFAIVDAATAPTVLNEPVFSNTRGTIAMAKAGTPDSAINQWFFNTVDNAAVLDILSGGFTVFGHVLGGEDGTDLDAGMQVLDTIMGLQKFRPCSPFEEVPCPRADFAPIVTDEFQGEPDKELVFVNMEVVSRYSTAVNLFDPVSLLVITSIGIDDGATSYSANFSVSAAGEQILLTPNADSVLLLNDLPEGAATYSSSTERLSFPMLELSESEQICQVEFQLSNPELLQFSLVGYDPC